MITHKKTKFKIRFCSICRKVMVNKRSNAIYCTDCYRKRKYNKLKEHMKLKRKEYRSVPENKERIKEYQREYWKTYIRKQKRSCAEELMNESESNCISGPPKASLQIHKQQLKEAKG